MDTIGDFLTQIRNAQAVGHKTVKVPFSKLRYQLAQVLAEENFIEKVVKKGRKNRKSLLIYLKYEGNGEPKIKEMKKVTKPGQRIYKSADEIERVRGGFGIGIVSTSRGLMTHELAQKKNLGGEVLCKIW